MKFTVDQAILASRVATVARGLATRNVLPALSGVRMTAGDGKLVLAATDGELGVKATLPSSVEEDGDVLVPGRLLHDVVRQLPPHDVKIAISEDGRSLVLDSDTASFRVQLLPVGDFPPLPAPADQQISVPADDFTHTVDQVARSASRDETRPHLTGVFVTGSEKELQMVATDSYRLSVKRTALEQSLASSIEANIPARALQEVTRMADDAGSIGISLQEHQIVFVLDQVVVNSRLVEGQFPNYRQLLEVTTSHQHELMVDRQEMLDAVRRVSLMAQRNTPLRLEFAEGELALSAQTPDVGEASETIPIAGFVGEKLSIGFNPEFLRDGLESADGDEVRLRLGGPTQAGLIESGSDAEFVYLVMPVRLDV